MHISILFLSEFKKNVFIIHENTELEVVWVWRKSWEIVTKTNGAIESLPPPCFFNQNIPPILCLLSSPHQHWYHKIILYVISDKGWGARKYQFQFPWGFAICQPGRWNRSEFIKIQFTPSLLPNSVSNYVFPFKEGPPFKLEIVVCGNSIWMGSVLVRKCKDQPGLIKSVQLVFRDPQIYIFAKACLFKS